MRGEVEAVDDTLVVCVCGGGVWYGREVGDFGGVVGEEVEGGAVDDAGVGAEGVETAEVGEGGGEGGGLGGVGCYVCWEEFCGGAESCF